MITTRPLQRSLQRPAAQCRFARFVGRAESKEHLVLRLRPTLERYEPANDNRSQRPPRKVLQKPQILDTPFPHDFALVSVVVAESRSRLRARGDATSAGGGGECIERGVMDGESECSRGNWMRGRTVMMPARVGGTEWGGRRRANVRAGERMVSVMQTRGEVFHSPPAAADIWSAKTYAGFSFGDDFNFEPRIEGFLSMVCWRV